MSTVEAIHHHVDQCNEELITEGFFNKSKDVIDELKAMGFINAKNVTDEEDHRETHHLAVMYRQKYPGYKFITHRQLNQICTDHELKWAALTEFKGEIPEKNAREMIAAKIQAKDLDVSMLSAFGTRENPIVIKATAGDAMMYDISRGISGIMEIINKEVAPKKVTEALMNTDPERFLKISEINKIAPNALIIIADPKLFVAPKKFVCPMPSVMVKGGFLILTAWGAEAGHQNVVNEKMN
jgi:hypothetical protein